MILYSTSYFISYHTWYDIIHNIIHDIIYVIINLWCSCLDCICSCSFPAANLPHTQHFDLETIDDCHDDDREMDFDEECDFADLGPLVRYGHGRRCSHSSDIFETHDVTHPLLHERGWYWAVTARHSLPTASGGSSQDCAGGCRVWRLATTGCWCSQRPHRERTHSAGTRSKTQHNMWEEGDGLQDNTFVKHKVLKVLMELIANEHMSGRQLYSGRLKTQCYPFNLKNHLFLGKNCQVVVTGTSYDMIIFMI